MSEFKIFSRGVIFNQQGEVLLTKKNDQQKIGAGCWMPPGGTVEIGEAPEETVKRELLEEVNLKASKLTLLTTRTHMIGETHWLGVYFYVEVENDYFVNNEPDKHEIVEWKAIEDLPEMRDKDVILMGKKQREGSMNQ